MPKKREAVPAFASEAEERAYWEAHDSSGAVDWRRARRVRLPNLKPSTVSISLRVPVGLLEQIGAYGAAQSRIWQPVRKALCVAWRPDGGCHEPPLVRAGAVVRGDRE